MRPEPGANPRRRIAVFGGIYNNHLALSAAMEDARRRGVEELYCLGDLGGFGPHPDRVFPLLRDEDVRVVQGNYDRSIGHGLADCQCGYTDPRDDYFARLSYEYTLRKTSETWRGWLRELPGDLRISLGGRRVLMCHGSPRRTNEFLWESTTSSDFLDWLMSEYEADVILATHTGLPWSREVTGGRLFANVGVLGRPANDGRTEVCYALLEENAGGAAPGAGVSFELVPLSYDHERLAREMRDEQLPAEFVETILTGWWTTCLEVLPAKERRAGRH